MSERTTQRVAATPATTATAPASATTTSPPAATAPPPSSATQPRLDDLHDRGNVRALFRQSVQVPQDMDVWPLVQIASDSSDGAIVAATLEAILLAARTASAPAATTATTTDATGQVWTEPAMAASAAERSSLSISSDSIEHAWSPTEHLILGEPERTVQLTRDERHDLERGRHLMDGAATATATATAAVASANHRMLHQFQCRQVRQLIQLEAAAATATAAAATAAATTTTAAATAPASATTASPAAATAPPYRLSTLESAILGIDQEPTSLAEPRLDSPEQAQSEARGRATPGAAAADTSDGDAPLGPPCSPSEDQFLEALRMSRMSGDEADTTTAAPTPAPAAVARAETGEETATMAGPSTAASSICGEDASAAALFDNFPVDLRTSR